MDGCFPTALGIENQPLATFWDLPFSHSDASILRKSHLVTKLKAAVYPWEGWSKFLIAGCPSSHQPTRIREDTLESGGSIEQKLNFRLRTLCVEMISPLHNTH